MPRSLWGLAEDDSLSASFDQALLIPGAEDTADGVLRRSRHFGDVLTADREVDFDVVRFR